MEDETFSQVSKSARSMFSIDIANPSHLTSAGRVYAKNFQEPSTKAQQVPNSIHQNHNVYSSGTPILSDSKGGNAGILDIGLGTITTVDENNANDMQMNTNDLRNVLNQCQQVNSQQQLLARAQGSSTNVNTNAIS